MTGFHKTICGVICGLMLVCNSGVLAYGADRCVTEVLNETTTAFPVSDDLTFELKLEKDKDLIFIPNPEEVLDKKSALKKDLTYTLPHGKYNARYELKRELAVRTEDGQRYRLSPETPFELVSLPAGFEYTAILPAGTLIKKKGTAADEYALDKDKTVEITPPKHIQTAMQLYSQTKVDRIFDPGTSSMGTTITVNPKKAPLGAYIKLFVKKRDFDFGKARFDVCLRLQGKDEQESKPFFASDDVELEKAERDEAILRVRIPEKIDGMGGVYLAKPVDLLLVASIPGDEVKRTEVMTQKFSISSRPLAGLIWIFAFILPWFLTACVAGRMQSNTLTGEDARASYKNQCNAWKAKLNPIWIVSGKTGGASLSLAQVLLWTILVFSASFYVLVVSGKLLDLSDDILVLLGLAGGASVIAKITAAAKDGKGQALSKATEKEPKWLDLIKTEERPDLYKFQMALFTTLAAVFVIREIYSTLEFPILPAGLLTLIGISNGVYLTAKASSKSAFEELAEMDTDLKKANENLEKCNKNATESEQSIDRTKVIMETAEKTLRETEKQLEDAEKAKDTGIIAELSKKVEKQKAALLKATADYSRASDEKDQADAAVSGAQQILDKLRVSFEEKKKQLLQ